MLIFIGILNSCESSLLINLKKIINTGYMKEKSSMDSLFVLIELFSFKHYFKSLCLIIFLAVILKPDETLKMAYQIKAHLHHTKK